MVNGLGDVEGVPADGGVGTVRVTAGVTIMLVFAARLDCSTVVAPGGIKIAEGCALTVAGVEVSES